MSFNARDYIKALPNDLANDREIWGDQVDMKINDLRKDTIAAFDALALDGCDCVPAPASITTSMIQTGAIDTTLIAPETITVALLETAPTTVSPPLSLFAPASLNSDSTIQRQGKLASGDLYLAYNARPTNAAGTTWASDVSGQTATAYVFSGGGEIISTKTLASAPSTWNDNQWDKYSTQTNSELFAGYVGNANSFVTFREYFEAGFTAAAMGDKIIVYVRYSKRIPAPSLTITISVETNRAAGTPTLTSIANGSIHHGCSFELVAAASGFVRIKGYITIAP